MELMTTCRTCGESWTPDHAAYVRGTWRACTRCRGDPGEQAPGAIEADAKRSQGQRTSPKCQAEREPIMSTRESVFSLQSARLRDDIKAKRAELRTDPTNRVLELGVEDREARLAQVDQQHADWVGAENQRAADATKRDADARAELEQRLMSAYIASAPGTSEAEARAALPDLLHRFRLGEQGRMADAFAAQRRRLGSF